MRTRLLVLVTATISTILVAAPANAAGTVVTGAQTPVFSGPCFDATEAFSTTMDGGLLGCWYGDTFVLTSEHPSGAEIHGRCSHPIVSGTGGFEGVSGIVEFTDDVTTGISYYTGVVRL